MGPALGSVSHDQANTQSKDKAAEGLAQKSDLSIETYREFVLMSSSFASSFRNTFAACVLAFAHCILRKHTFASIRGRNWFQIASIRGRLTMSAEIHTSRRRFQGGVEPPYIWCVHSMRRIPAPHLLKQEQLQLTGPGSNVMRSRLQQRTGPKQTWASILVSYDHVTREKSRLS